VDFKTLRYRSLSRTFFYLCGIQIQRNIEKNTILIRDFRVIRVLSL